MQFEPFEVTSLVLPVVRQTHRLQHVSVTTRKTAASPTKTIRADAAASSSTDTCRNIVLVLEVADASFHKCVACFLRCEVTSSGSGVGLISSKLLKPELLSEAAEPPESRTTAKTKAGQILLSSSPPSARSLVCPPPSLVPFFPLPHSPSMSNSLLIQFSPGWAHMGQHWNSGLS